MIKTAAKQAGLELTPQPCGNPEKAVFICIKNPPKDPLFMAV
jgi:hypothetical protein